ncbi:MAG TPA: SDR family oxidoreductase [Kofleriaceae bacterium]|nr:SDR family oxidoreductase [Kofleriaceae bacterium]
MQIEGIVAFVTGTNRGLGRAFVAELLARGARRVYAASRGGEAHIDPRVVPVPLDITDPEQVRAAAAAAPDVQLLINNAGRNTAGLVLSSEPERLRQDMDVNVHGTLEVTRAFVPALEKNQPAAVVNILSVASLANLPMVGGYSVTKAALWSLTQALRAGLRDRGIRVHGAFPGVIDTDMAREFKVPKASPEEVVRATLDGVTAGKDDIETDPMSSQMMELFARDPRALERQFGA